MPYNQRKIAVHSSVKQELLDQIVTDAYEENRTVAAIIREILKEYYRTPTKPFKLFDRSS